MQLAVGSDHAGYPLKAVVVAHLEAQGHLVVDVGTTSAQVSVNYPDFARDVGEAVLHQGCELGIVICGSGIGVAIAANKLDGIRAATIHDVTSAHLAREHNHANVIAFGARFIGETVALEAVDAFLAATPLDGRHAERVAMISALEVSNASPSTGKGTP